MITLTHQAAEQSADASTMAIEAVARAMIASGTPDPEVLEVGFAVLQAAMFTLAAAFAAHGHRGPWETAAGAVVRLFKESRVPSDSEIGSMQVLVRHALAAAKGPASGGILEATGDGQ